MKILVIVVSVLIIISLIAFYFVANFLFNGILDKQNKWFEDVAHAQVNTDIEAEHDQLIVQREQEQLQLGEAFWEQPQQYCQLTSFDGLVLKGRLFYSSTPSDKWLICFHGYRTSGKTDMGYIGKEMTKTGFNCLIVDQRAHGESEGRFITMGWLERRDVLSWTEYLIALANPTDIVWFGDSMGAATVLMASGEEVPDVVHGIIADCGYTSLKDLFNYLLKSAYHVPTWLPIVPIFSLLTKVKLGFSLYQASAYKQLQKNRRPILFIHGDSDTFVPLSMSQINMAATAGPKELLVVKDAPHFSAVLFEPVAYFTAINQFLTTYIN